MLTLCVLYRTLRGALPTSAWVSGVLVDAGTMLAGYLLGRLVVGV